MLRTLSTVHIIRFPMCLVLLEYKSGISIVSVQFLPSHRVTH